MAIFAFSLLIIFERILMSLGTNAICETRHARQSTIAQSLDKVVRTILLIAFTSVVTACSGVPLIPGI